MIENFPLQIRLFQVSSTVIVRYFIKEDFKIFFKRKLLHENEKKNLK
jgi:hypothetical protein